MKTKEKTTVEKLRRDLKTQQTQVMRLSNVKEIDYNAFQYEVGMQVLEAHMIEDEQVRRFSSKKEYWNFFKMLWRNHERAVIYFLNEKQEFDWNDYQNKMQEMVECRRTWLSLRQYMSINNRNNGR